MVTTNSTRIIHSHFNGNLPPLEFFPGFLKLAVGTASLFAAYKLSQLIHQKNAKWLGIDKQQQVRDYVFSKWTDGMMIDAAAFLGCNMAGAAMHRFDLCSDPKKMIIFLLVPYSFFWGVIRSNAQMMANLSTQDNSKKLTLRDILELETAILKEAACLYALASFSASFY